MKRYIPHFAAGGAAGLQDNGDEGMAFKSIVKAVDNADV